MCFRQTLILFFLDLDSYCIFHNQQASPYIDVTKWLQDLTQGLNIIIYLLLKTDDFSVIKLQLFLVNK